MHAEQLFHRLQRPRQLLAIARDAEAEFRANPVTNPTVAESVVEKFREKYGAKDVKKYYSKFDVAVMIPVD